LFGQDQSAINKHINNLFAVEELDSKRNMQKMHIPNPDKQVSFYSLKVGISVC
jgi:hypothetical protein